MELEDLRSKLMQAKSKDKHVRSDLTCDRKQPRVKYCNFCKKKGNNCSRLNLLENLEV